MKIIARLIFSFLFLFLLSYPSFAATSDLSVSSEDGVEIHFKTQGKGTPVLVFVHGWSCDKTYWSEQVPFFSKIYKTITIDLAGHGNSGINRTDWTIERFGSDVAAVLNKLNVNQVILIGHSLGGAVIVEAARKVPNRVIGIVGVDSNALRNPVDDSSLGNRDKLISALNSNFKSTMHFFVKSYLFVPTSDSDLVEKVSTDMASQSPEIGIEVFKGLQNWQKGKDWDSIQKVNKPIALINNEKHIPSQEYYKTFSNFRYRLMSGVGHFIMIEDPNTFNKLLLEEIKTISRLSQASPAP